jgi:predicted benzoate:H+ symporter BenE
VSTLVRAELLKLRTTRLPFVFALAVAGLALLGTVASALTAGRPDARTPPLESPEGVRNVFSAGAGAATTWAMVLGIIVVSASGGTARSRRPSSSRLGGARSSSPSWPRCSRSARSTPC